MLGEFELIRRYLAPLAAGAPGAFGLTEDAALLAVDPDRDQVLTTDTIISGVHFLPGDPPDLVARKLLRVNLSDLASMGAAPAGYLLNASWPQDVEEGWIAGFVEGLSADQKDFGIVLLGGDTTRTPGPLTLSLTAVGTVPKGRCLRRAGGQDGDLLFVSGTLGDAALGLAVQQGRLEGLSDRARDALIDRYRLPRPRLALGNALLMDGLATAAVDVSDGLVADLGHVAAASKLAATIEAPCVPVSPAAQEAMALDATLRDLLLTGGDDYELLVAVPPSRESDLAALAERLGLPLTGIGTLRDGEGVRVVDASGEEIRLDKVGWRHF